MTINARLTYKRCWDMVNSIQLAGYTSDIRRKCDHAEEWIEANEVITDEQYKRLMAAIAFWRRTADRIDQGFRY